MSTNKRDDSLGEITRDDRGTPFMNGRDLDGGKAASEGLTWNVGDRGIIGANFGINEPPRRGRPVDRNTETGPTPVGQPSSRGLSRLPQGRPDQNTNKK